MMKLFRNFAGAVGIALTVFAVAGLSIVPVFAQPNPVGNRSFTPRVFQTQQTHYLRFTVNFNSCVIPAGAAVCGAKVGTLPYNAFLKSVVYDLITVFNPTTSAT